MNQRARACRQLAPHYVVPRRRPAACPRDPGKASPTLELDKLISYPCIFDRIFRVLSEDADMEFLLMDGTIVKAHQPAAGAKKK